MGPRVTSRRGGANKFREGFGLVGRDVAGAVSRRGACIPRIHEREDGTRRRSADRRFAPASKPPTIWAISPSGLRCRLLLAEIEIVQRRFGDANDLLNAIASDEGGRTIGPELRAQTHYLQARLQAARGDVAGAAASTEAARALIRGLEEQLPENYRALFAKREAVQRLTQ